MSGPPDIRILRDLPVPLADGTVTRAEAWLPDDGAPHPAILVRTPYRKEAETPTPLADARRAAARGWAVVVQDVRGKGASEGAFEPFVHEERDGADSIAWVAAQDWCDGDVVMAGMSYVGATQWLAAAARPPALRAIAPALSSDDAAEGWSHHAGVPLLGFLASWSCAELAPDPAAVDDPSVAWDDPDRAAATAPWLAEWLREPPGSAYWRARSVAHRRDDVAVPARRSRRWGSSTSPSTSSSSRASPSW